MAGDWIKMRVDLGTDPAVISVAAALGLDEDAVVGKLHRLWSWASCQTVDGNAPGVTDAWIDRYLGAPGFARAMAKAGWLAVGDDGVTIPKWDAHNSQSAKQRALTAKRVALCKGNKQRPGNGAGVTGPSAGALPREEKRRENTPLPPEGEERGSLRSKGGPEEAVAFPAGLDTPAFRDAWARWGQHRREIRCALKPSTRRAQLKKLAGFGEAVAIAAIDYSIEQGWKGLFPEKIAPGGTPSGPPDGEGLLSRDEMLDRQRRQLQEHREALKAQACCDGDGGPAPERQERGH